MGEFRLKIVVHCSMCGKRLKKMKIIRENPNGTFVTACGVCGRQYHFDYGYPELDPDIRYIPAARK